jgi:hypothetical protein
MSTIRVQFDAGPYPTELAELELRSALLAAEAEVGGAG